MTALEFRAWLALDLARLDYEAAKKAGQPIVIKQPDPQR